jgi:hypothetical protein
MIAEPREARPWATGKNSDDKDRNNDCCLIVCCGSGYYRRRPASTNSRLDYGGAVERKLNTMCRGWSPGSVRERRLDQICSTRDNLRKALNKMGYCYGKRHDAGMKWHRCTSTSLRYSN